MAADETLTARKRLSRPARHGHPAAVKRPAAAIGLGPGPLAAGLVAVILWGLAPVATRAAVGIGTTLRSAASLL